MSDATDEMGCLRIDPGSHKLGPTTRSNGQSLSKILLEQDPQDRANHAKLPPNSGSAR